MRVASHKNHFFEHKVKINLQYLRNNIFVKYLFIMEILAAFFILALLLGLLFRKKGDGFLDTIQSGCWILIVLGLLAAGYFIYLNLN